MKGQRIILNTCWLVLGLFEAFLFAVRFHLLPVVSQAKAHQMQTSILGLLPDIIVVAGVMLSLDWWYQRHKPPMTKREAAIYRVL